MKICPDCYAANRSHHTYCQKCSGSLTGRSRNSYPQLTLSKKRQRRVPFKLSALS